MNGEKKDSKDNRRLFIIYLNSDSHQAYLYTDPYGSEDVEGLQGSGTTKVSAPKDKDYDQGTEADKVRNQETPTQGTSNEVNKDDDDTYDTSHLDKEDRHSYED